MVGCGGAAVFGNPRDINDRPNIKSLMKHFAPKTDASAGQDEPFENVSDPKQSSSSSRSSIQSQTGASPLRRDDLTLIGGLSDSQERISTQAPPQPFVSPGCFQPKTDVKEILRHLDPRPDLLLDSEPTIQSEGHTSPNGNGCPPPPTSATVPNHPDTPRSHSIPLPERHSTPRAADLPTAAEDESLNLEPGSTASNLKRKNSPSNLGSDSSIAKSTAQSSTKVQSPADNAKNSTNDHDHADLGPWRWTKRIRLQDVRIPKDQEELIERQDSWVPPLEENPMPRGYVPIGLLREWNYYHSRGRKQAHETANPSGCADNGGQLNRPTSWRWAKRIRLQDVRIPRDQQKLIDNENSWVPPPTGDRMPQCHVPIHLLQQWNDHYSQWNEEQRQNSSLPAENPALGVGESQDENEIREALRSPPQSSAQVHWSTSPERSPLRPQLPPELPPDSSPVKQQQAPPVEDSSAHGLGSLPNSAPRTHTKLSNGSEQIREEFWSDGNYTQVGPSNPHDRSEAQSDDCDMETSIPIPLVPQAQSQEPTEMEEDISSSGPSLPIPASKGDSFTQVKQSPALVSFGSHRNGCISVSGRYKLLPANSSSSTKLSSDPRIPATYDTPYVNNSRQLVGTERMNSSQNIPTSSYIEGGEVQDTSLIMDKDHDILMGNATHSNSHFTAQAVTPSVKVVDTPLVTSNNIAKMPVSHSKESNLVLSEPQSLKRKRGNTEPPFKTPSKRHKSLNFLNFNDTPKPTSSRDVSESIAECRQNFFRKEHSFRTTQDIFDKFKQSYPDYKGSVKHFIGMCRKLQALRSQGTMERCFLWDDFIIHQTTKYREYLDMCADAVEDPDIYEEYFLRSVTKPAYKKRSLTSSDLQIVLTECGDPAAANVRTTSTTPLSVRSESRGSLARAGSASFAGSANPSPPTTTAKEAEQRVEETILEIKETQPQPITDAGGSGNDGDDEDDEDDGETPVPRNARDTHGDYDDDRGTPVCQDVQETRGDDDDDREIPCTPMEGLHETASIELGDDDEDEDSNPHEAQRASSRVLEDTFSDYGLELNDMESVASTETPIGPEVPGQNAAIPIEIGSSLESKVETENAISQEGLDLDYVVGVNEDEDDESYKDDGDEESDGSYHGSDDNNDDEEVEECNDDADAKATHESDNNHSTHSHSSPPSGQSSIKKKEKEKEESTIIYHQVLSCSSQSSGPSSLRADKPHKSPQPSPPTKQQPQWHDLPNTPYKLFAQSYANLRSELGERPPTYWTKQNGSEKSGRKPVPVDEKGVTHPPLRSSRHRDGREDSEKRVFKRGQIGWSF